MKGAFERALLHYADTLKAKLQAFNQDLDSLVASKQVGGVHVLGLGWLWWFSECCCVLYVCACQCACCVLCVRWVWLGLCVDRGASTT